MTNYLLAGDLESLRVQNFTLQATLWVGAIVFSYMARHNGFGVSKLVLFAPVRI
ncbi:hypothetical protein P6N53_05025 [Desulforamulus aquiferis]|uniref:Uncharacterized protein n=1 Tax=Desulforamulus aquiferis TaxID=1397668 RepID=A0AAW7ZBP7_9FIRM|nr:hypothetical protein [Desulforamulus aquiferis]